MEAWLLFHSRAHFSRAGVKCARVGETQADDLDAAAPYIVAKEQGLQPYLVPLRLLGYRRHDSLSSAVR
eukprot:1859838-Prymnesium_polylepis.1